MLDSCSNDEILRFLVLKYKPHAFDVVFGIAPVAEGGKIAEIELLLLSLSDTCGSKGYLASNEGLATTLTLMVEQDA